MNRGVSSEEKARGRRTGSILTGLVRAECANWVGGQCMGLTVYSVPFRPSGACSIMQGKPCTYFEKTVLKAARKAGNEKAIRKYAEVAPEAAQEGEGRRCECGELLPHRRRLCPKCALRNKRKAHRESWHRQRGKKAASLTGQLTENGISNPLKCNEL